MARDGRFRESAQEALLLLHSLWGFLTKLEETTYASQAGISYQQALILITVESSEPPVTETTISKGIQRNLNSVSMMIDRMEKLGLVKRVRSEDDRRQVHISLTPLGRERLANAIEVGRALNERLGSALSEEELQETMRIMAKLRNQTLKEMGRESIPSDSEDPNWERVIELFKKGVTNGRQSHRAVAKTKVRHARTPKRLAK
jgi:DNA-binding MarR family transcriptional regulator